MNEFDDIIFGDDSEKPKPLNTSKYTGELAVYEKLAAENSIAQSTCCQQAHAEVNSDSLEKDLFDKAIELLSRREHSQKELSQKLLKRFECTQAHIDALLARVVDLGYQSDERFANAFIRTRLARGLGARRVAQEAKQKGLGEALIQQVLDEESEEFSSQTMIEQVWRKKFKSLPTDQKERAKQYRFLQYRGFGGDDISRLYDRLKQDSE